MTVVRTARVKREERKARVSIELASALDRLGHSRMAIADICGVSATMATEWTLAEKDRAVSVADAMAMPVDLRIALAQLILGDDHVISEAPAQTAAPETADVHMLLRSQREHAEALSTYAEALSDGVIDPTEAATLEREAEEAIRATMAIRDRARAARAARGVVVPLAASVRGTR